MSDGPAIPTYGARRAMPTEGFLEQATSFDIDANLAKLDPQFDAAKRDREQVCACAAKLLGDDMRPILEWLLDTTLRRPVFMGGLGEHAASYCAMREGQNQIVWRLLQAIAEGREQHLANREGM